MNKNEFLDLMYKFSENKVEFLKMLSQDEDKEIKEWVAKSKDAPLEMLKMLSQDNSFEVLKATSQNQNTSPELQEQVFLQIIDIEKYKFQNLSFITQNHCITEPVMQKLVNHNDARVRGDLAKNIHIKLPTKLEKKLSKDDVEWVRLALAKNPNTSSETLKELIKDKGQVDISDDPFDKGIYVSIGDIATERLNNKQLEIELDDDEMEI